MSTETSADVLAPPKPIMGDIIALAKDSWSAWTGGKPKADWTGLDPSSQTETTSPNQLRPVYVSAAQKGYNHRRTGMTTLFKPADDLTSFQNAVWDHLTDTGMDSIAYIPDPLDNQKMTNVVKSHARYTVQSAKLLVESQLSKYDKYDRTNDKAARTYLLASLSATLSNKVAEKLEDSDPFPIVWLQFLKAIQSTSIERFEDLKNSIKLRLPSQYPGENLEQLAAQFRKDARELTTAGQYDHNLTLSMMKIFLLAGGSGNEDFRFPLRATKQRLEQALLDIGFKEKTAANKHMNEQKLTYKDICAEAEDTYRTLFDRKEWPPARNVRDSKAPPTAFGNVAADANAGITRAEVLNLMQNKPRFNGTDSSKKPGNCNKCGKPGHWARECPDGKQQSANPRAQRNSRPDNRFNDRNSRKPGWRSVPPAPGAPTMKKTDTHTFNWCSPCKRWTTTHSTATHKGKSSGGGEQQTSAMVSLVQDPSVWTTDVDVSFSTSDLLFVVWKHLPIVAVLLLCLSPLLFAGLMSFKALIAQVASYLAQVEYRLIVEFVFDFVVGHLNTFSEFLSTNYHALPAPSLWFVLMMFLLWYRPDSRSNAPPVDLPPPLRSHRRLLDKHSRRQFRMNQHEMQRRSILTEGLNRRYPICLRSLGHYVRRHNAPSIEQQDIIREIEKLKFEVLRLKNQVRRFEHKTPERPSQAPGREGGRFRANQKQGFARRQDTFWSNQGQAWDVTRKDTAAPNENSGFGDRWLPVNRSCASRTHDKKSAFYRPVPVSGRNSYYSITNWTDRQIHAAKQIAHVKMAQLHFNADGTTTQAALHAPSRFRSSMPPNAVFPIIWDSGASVTISPSKLDFVGSIVSPSVITQLKGIAKGLRIEGQGNVRWCFHDEFGNLRTLTLPAYYVPKIRIRLLSTTSLLQAYADETIKVEADKLTLSGIDGNPNRNPIVARVNPQNNLPTSEAYRHEDTVKAFECLNATIAAVNETNFNLTEPEKELLRWHYRLGHMSFKKIQFLLRTGVLTRGDSKRRLHHAACNIQSPPKCAACQYGKQHRRPAPGRVSTAVRDRDGVLKKEHLVPGQQVSVDHFVCSTKGRLLTSAGKSLRSEMFCGGCLFNDHASGFVHVEFQKHLNTHETLKAKEKFDLMCRDNGVIPQSYLSDNAGSFTSKSFTEKLSKFSQVIRFAGVGAHHHNGVAERSIQTIMSIARTMMLHSAIHWPDVADTTLWPMAVSHAVFLHNHMPNIETGISPVDIFTKSRWQQHKYHDLHVWGCPVYVLEKKISDGAKIPRWKPRSTRQMNVGFSEKHASTVPLVLNIDSGYITAQFHVVFDDWFSTIATSVENLPDFNSNAWVKLFGDSIYQYPFDDELDENTDETDLTNVNDAPAPNARTDRILDAMDNRLPVEPFPDPPPPVTRFPITPLPVATPVNAPSPLQPMSSTRERTPEVDSIVNVDSPKPQTLFPSPKLETPRPPTPSPVKPMSSMREPPMPETREPSPKPAPPPSPKQPSPAPKSHSPRRSGRNRSAPNRLGYDGKQGAGYFVEPSAWIFPECGLLPPPLALKVAPSDPDTLSYEAAMSDTPQNVVRWMEAAAKEIASLEKNGTWFEVDMSVAKTRILPGTWVFRRKRTPDGEISKFKARYCVRGDLEEGEPETFAPVVAWSSVRLFLVLSLTLNWDTCSIDFSSAFVQAHLEEPVWIHLPRGFRSEEGSNKCLQLVKSLYGLSVAPRLWFEHVLEAFTDQGFKQSQMDPCLLYKETILIVIYVDDVGIAYANESDLEKLLQNLTKRGLEFTKEGTFTDFLGIKFVKDPKNNTVTLTQRGLIQKIIATTGMNDCNPNWTPATQTALGIDPDGEPMQETWSYPSIVGMMLYLSTNTRPDISFAVSQVARFNHSPKKSHATAIKTIVRYLHRTSDKGTIVRPTGDLSVDCYVDADFAGLHGRDPDYAPSSAKSRTGYIITLGGCPILWKSQLQTEISLSTLEAEYSALSASMRTLLPLRSLLNEIVAALKLPPQFKSTIRCRVFEDNNGALLLATNQRITNRTKYFLVKWHFFWSHVQNGDVNVLKIDTAEQWADYLTKGLSREAFERIRKLVQGW